MIITNFKIFENDYNEKLKIGDIVKCTRNDYNRILIIDKIYEIIDMKDHNNSLKVKNINYWFNFTYFILATPEDIEIYNLKTNR